MCEGRCQVQFYEVDFIGITVVADKDNGDWCKGESGLPERMRLLRDEVQPYFVKIGCKEDECVCDLYPNQKPTWTEWRQYNAPGDVIIFLGAGAEKPCKFTLTGTYQVSTCIEDGLCIKTPKDWKPYDRRKNPKIPPKIEEKK